MDLNYDPAIRLDKYGRPDVDYYVSEAKRLRNLAIRQLFQESAAWLFMQVGKRLELPLTAK